MREWGIRRREAYTCRDEVAEVNAQNNEASNAQDSRTVE
jgi:hypothetical protein